MKEATKKKTLGLIDRLGFFFFCVLAWILPISGAGIEICFGFIYLCFLAKFFIERPNRVKIKEFFLDRINLAVLIFYLCIGLSVLISGPYIKHSLRVWFSKWGEGVLFFYFAQIFLNKQRIKRVLTVFLASAFLLSVDGIYQWVYGVDFVRGFDLTYVEGEFSAVRATFSHFNNFAGFITVMFLIGLAFLVKIKKFWIKFILVILLALLAINLTLTHSRAGLISLLIGLTPFLVFLANRKYRVKITLAFMLFGVIFVSLPFSAKILADFILRADAGRIQIWKAGVSMFLDSPLLGKGLGNFMKYTSDYGLVPLYAHNCYLQLLAESGLIGLISFLWFLAEIISRGIKRVITEKNPLFLGLFFGLLVYLFHAFFDTHLYSFKLSMFFWLIASFVTIFLKAHPASLNRNS